MKKSVFGGIIFLLCTAVFTACNNDPEPQPVITITIQPLALTNVTAGSISENLSVSANVTQGAALSYQWYSNTTDSNTSGTAINFAAGASYPIPASLTAGTYYYFCEVKAVGAVSVRSNVATVNVAAAPSLSTLNFAVSGNNKTYNGSPQGATVAYAGEGIDTDAAGSISVYYSGKNDTDYEESSYAPFNAGSYDILVSTGGGTIYAPFAKTVVGTLTINKAAGSFVPTAALYTIYTSTLTLADLMLPDNYAWSSPASAIANAGNEQSFPAAYTEPGGNYEPAAGSITVNVAKGAGAVIDAPTLAGRTQNSISINTVSASTGQSVVYAISTANTVPANDWQSGLSFSGLGIGTSYYIFARAQGNNNYETGEARSLAASTLQNVSQEIFEYYWVNAHGSLVTSSGGAATISTGDTLTITAQGDGYTVVQWHVNGINTGQSGNTFNFISFASGPHTIGLFVEKDGKLYNTNISIMVEAETRLLVVDMYNSAGNDYGWVDSYLRIVVNGAEIANNLQVGPYAYSNNPYGQTYANKYTFSVTVGSTVDIYFAAGRADLMQNKHQNSFVVYYTDTPPSPEFYSGPLSGTDVGPVSWSGSNALVYRVRGNAPEGLNDEDDGALLGSFTVVLE